MQPVRRVILAAVACLCAAAASAEEKFFLAGGETIVFFGDSITQNGQYINYVEAYLLTRFPEKSFRLINRGISSETISGTTEEDHDPPRPWALPRFTRDIAALNPDVVVACFGMNDGNYYPFEPVRFEKYQDGIRTLIARTRRETPARLVLMTPPPFDPYRRKASDAEAVTFGYKFPAVDYDHTLAEYSRWLVSLRKEGQVVVDLHAAMNAHLAERRKRKVSFHLSPDAVHPNVTGHWLMAQQLLLEWGAPAVAAHVTIDAQRLTADCGRIDRLERSGTGLSFRWTSPLPMPMDPAWDAESIALEKVAERLNRYRLTITGLERGAWQLSAASAGEGPFVDLGSVSAHELAQGLDLLTFAELPTNARSRKLLELVQSRRGIAYRLYRREIGQPLDGKPADQDDLARDRAELERISARIETMRQPAEMLVRVLPATAEQF